MLLDPNSLLEGLYARVPSPHWRLPTSAAETLTCAAAPLFVTPQILCDPDPTCGYIISTGVDARWLDPLGGGVTGGVYGRHPGIFTLDDDENTIYSQAAVTHRSTDFRDVYGTILKHFVNMTPANILANVLPLDGGDPASYWTAANFDLGFL